MWIKKDANVQVFVHRAEKAVNVNWVYHSGTEMKSTQANNRHVQAELNIMLVIKSLRTLQMDVSSNLLLEAYFNHTRFWIVQPQYRRLKHRVKSQMCTAKRCRKRWVASSHIDMRMA